MKGMSEQRIGRVEHFYNKIRVAVVKLEAPLKLGDWLRIKGAHDDVWVRVRSMEVDHKPIASAAAGQSVGIKVPKRTHQGSSVLRAEKVSFWHRLLGR